MQYSAYILNIKTVFQANIPFVRPFDVFDRLKVNPVLAFNPPPRPHPSDELHRVLWYSGGVGRAANSKL